MITDEMVEDACAAAHPWKWSALPEVWKAHRRETIRAALTAGLAARRRRDDESVVSLVARYDDEICQTLGAALGYPLYCDDQKNFPGATEADGVFVGEHVAAKIAAETATALTKTKAELDASIQRIAYLLDANARLMRERDDVDRAWVAANLELTNALARPEAAERQVATLREAANDLLDVSQPWSSALPNAVDRALDRLDDARAALDANTGETHAA